MYVCWYPDIETKLAQAWKQRELYSWPKFMACSDLRQMVVQISDLGDTDKVTWRFWVLALIVVDILDVHFHLLVTEDECD